MGGDARDGGRAVTGVPCEHDRGRFASGRAVQSDLPRKALECEARPSHGDRPPSSSVTAPPKMSSADARCSLGGGAHCFFLFCFFWSGPGTVPAVARRRRGGVCLSPGPLPGPDRPLPKETPLALTPVLLPISLRGGGVHARGRSWRAGHVSTGRGSLSSILHHTGSVGGVSSITCKRAT